VRPFASPFDHHLNLLLELSLLTAIMALIDQGSGAEGLAYAIVGLSGAVSLLRLAARAAQPPVIDRATESVSEETGHRNASGGPAKHRASLRGRSDDAQAPQRHPAPHHYCSEARLSRIDRIVNNSVTSSSHISLTLPQYSLAAADRLVQEMLDAVQRHRQLEATIMGLEHIGAHRMATCALPPRMQMDHLTKLVALSTQQRVRE
jgi:hypothetical protein